MSELSYFEGLDPDRLDPDETRRALYRLKGFLGASYGRADEQPPPMGSEPWRRLQGLRTALMVRAGEMPWQQRRAVWCGLEGAPEAAHRRLVERALAEGHRVPSRVLADYPDLGR